MLYRQMGKTGEMVSILGFGCMRLPIDSKSQHVDRKRSSSLLDYALESGINFIDTAYSYHGTDMQKGGDSEVFLGEYFQENSIRKDIYLCTKLPSWLVEKKEDFENFLEEQLKRLKTDYIDFYLLHSVKEKNWSKMEDLGVLDFLDSALEDGKIKYTGFSSHDGTDLFKDVIESYNWNMSMIQYNYLDENIQVGREGLKFAAKRKIGIAVMEPLKGGILANYTPPEVSEIWSKAPIKRNAAEWAFRYLWNHPEITTVLSGMNEMRHLVENIFSAEDGHPHSLNAQENELMEQVKEAYKKKIEVECSACEYCMPCPNGVNIPQCLSFLNQAAMLNDASNVYVQYHFMLKDEEKADKCLGCGLCEELCSQKLPIREKMKMAKQEFR